MVRRKIGIRQLKNEAPRILCEVREDEVEYVVTRHGEPVALISPIARGELGPDEESKLDRSLAQLKRTATRISAASSELSAAETVSRQRR